MCDRSVISFLVGILFLKIDKWQPREYVARIDPSGKYQKMT